MKNILIVLGTRPEAIKMCPLVKELKKYPELRVNIVVTGQHREMLKQVLECFEVIPDYDLKIMTTGQTLFDITDKIMKGMREIYKKEMPNIVLVHGDTTSAFASALAAFYMEIPVGHVEAGLRTYNTRSPYPEEFNRQAIGSIASWHFAPTRQAVLHLLEEHKEENHIFLTGNTVIDALKTTVSETYTHPILEWAREERLVLVTVHRRENLGEHMYAIFRAILRVLQEHPDVKAVYPIHLNPVIRKTAKEVFGDFERIKLIDPLDVIDCHNIMKHAELILTDSGGIQEEAPALGKPVLVLRDTTERPEGVEAGTLLLAGTEEEKIYQLFSRLLDDREFYMKMKNAVNPYGDGTASRQIAKILLRL